MGTLYITSTLLTQVGFQPGVITQLEMGTLYIISTNRAHLRASR
jgi:hypothetical protein